MAIGEDDAAEPLARAARVLRSVPEPGWTAIEDDVIDAVRAIPRGGWPLAVVDPAPGTAQGTITVSDTVLRTALARALRGDADHMLTAVLLDVDDEGRVLRGVHIDLAARYGADVHAAAERALEVAASVVTDVIGAVDGVAIDVAVTDVFR